MSKLEEQMKALKMRMEECKKQQSHHDLKKIHEECEAKKAKFEEEARQRREAKLKAEAKAKAEPKPKPEAKPKVEAKPRKAVVKKP